MIQPTTDIEQIVRHLSAQVAALSAKVDRLENPHANTVWMGINDAAKHPQLAGKISAKQIRDRVLKSISDPVEAPLVANIHYQVVPSDNSRARYVVNAVELVAWLEAATVYRRF